MSRRAVLALLAAAVLAGVAGLALLAGRDAGAPAPPSTPSAREALEEAARPVSASRPPRSRAAATPPAVAAPQPAAAPVAESAPAEARRRTISGVARTEGGALRGVTVRIRDTSGALLRELSTDADGAFRAEGLPATQVNVEVAPSVSGVAGTLVARRVVKVTETEPVEIAAAWAVAVRGRVLGPDGASVPGADVWVCRSDSERASAVAWTRSDAEGRYAVAVPATENSTLIADPGTDGASGRRFLRGVAEVQHGGALEIDIRCAEGKKVEGRVVDGSGRPLAGVRLRFAVQIARAATFATSRDDGTITCGGLDARYVSVALDPADRARSGLVLTPEMAVPGAPDPVTFVLAEPSTVRGRVRDASGAPVANWTITVTAADGGLERRPSTDAEGRFVVGRVPPGRYRVCVTWTPYREQARTHVVGEVEAGAPEVVLTFPETIAR